MNTQKHKIKFLPFEATFEIEDGANLFDAIKNSGLVIKATCGGNGTCGECRVKVLSGKYSSKSSTGLKKKHADQGYVLSCLTEVLGDLTIQLPHFQESTIKTVSESNYFNENKDSLSGIYEVDPLLKLFNLHIQPATLEENYSDLKRIQRELKKSLNADNIDCEYSILPRLSRVLRINEGKISVVVFNKNGSWVIIDVEPLTDEKNILGISCDIGTTTVALKLVDLKDGKILCSTSSLNQQVKCGEDVISRINYTQKPGRLLELHQLIVSTINHLIKTAVEASKINFADIYYLTLAGNTTMIHLLLNLEPRYIREEPYVPTLNGIPFLKSRDIGFKINPEGRVYCSPLVGSYVGADITSGLLCTPISKNRDQISILIDVGTNGELVIGNAEWLMTCACSAGPAFEGYSISCGMPAIDGAIEQVLFNDKLELEYKVIGGSRPKGVCGSGMVDLLAKLFINGFIDRQGKFNRDKKSLLLTQTDQGLGFVIENSERCFWGKDLVITENDIANLIRTKGSVFSACRLLLRNVGITFNDISSFYIAGGFGQNLNIENAILIGLFPDMDRNKFYYIGNSSLLGSYLILLSDKNRIIVNEIADKMTYIELNAEPGYMNEYTGSLFLPHTDMDLFPSVKKILENKINK